MFLKRFYDENLAHASYLVGCQASGEAIVIDAARDISPYLVEAEKQGLQITKATETHVHADYLSGTRQLAHRTGAVMYLSKEGGEDWQYGFLGEKDELVGDGDIITVGNLTLKALHTPGHTPEHISFLLTDHPAGDEPIGIFTGDFLFVGDVGRPDLLEKAAGVKDTMIEGAKTLYNSLRKFRGLPDHLQIWPAHGAGSACGKALGAIPSSVLGYEKKTNWAFRIDTEQEFVDAVLEGQPEPPKYFAQMKNLNKVGPPLLTGSLPPLQEPRHMAAVLSESTLIDLRGAEAFSQAHPKGALYLPSGSSFVTWAGWLLDYQKPVHLLVKTKQQAEEAVRALGSIGLDQVKGYFLSSAVPKAGIELEASHRIAPEKVNEDEMNILDVRSQNEWDEGHLKEARHIHLGYLLDNLERVPSEPVLYCGSGTRSLIASSLLQREGFQPTDILGGYAALAKAKELVA